MRVLVCAAEAPLPPLNGLRLPLREVVGALAARHEICVVAFRWPDQHGDAPAGVESVDLAPPATGQLTGAAARLRSVVRREPIDALQLGAAMSQRVAALRRQRPFDVAHVTPGSLAGVAPALAGVPAIIAPLDAWPLNVAAARAQAAGVHRGWLALQQRFVERYVAHAYRPFARVVMVSDDDAREARRLDPALPTAVIANGVDTQGFHPDGGGPRDRRRMLFTGTLSFPPNAQAARQLALEILPRVRRRLVDAELSIVGRAPDAATADLARLAGVSVHRDVPDLRPHLRAAGVFVCPMRSGTGIKNKLLEAMACGAPAVASRLACRGLAVRDGVEVLIADDPEAIATAVTRLLTDPTLAERISAAARAYTVANHAWDAVATRYEALYREAIEQRRAAG